MTRQELKKKRKQVVESKGYKEWEPQQDKLIAKRKESQKNAEIQKRKVELSNKKDNVKSSKNTETKQYFMPKQKISTIENVNKKFQDIILGNQEEQRADDKEKRKSNKLFQNLDTSSNKEKVNLMDQERADVKLSQEQLDRLSKMDRKGRVESLKGRSEKTLQEAELYALKKRNEETENRVNEAKGIDKFLAANEYLGKEFLQSTLSSFGQIKATTEHIQGRDKKLNGLESSQKYQETISSLGQNVNNRFLQNLGIAVEGVGQQTPQILLGASGAGALVGGLSEFSNTYNEMTLEDPNNKAKTMVTALLKGTVAGGLESALGLFGGGKLDELSKSQLAGIKNKLVRNAMSTAYDVAGEITEEQLENMIGYVIDKAVNDKDITMEQAIQEAEATFKQTGLTTLLMSALGLGGNTRREVNSIAERTNWVNQLNVTSPQKTELRKLAQDENITNEELYNQVMKIEQENAYQDTVYENVIKNAESTKKQQSIIENKEVLNQEQQTTLKQGENAQNTMSEQPLGNDKYKIKMPNSNYKFEKTGDINSDNLDESMSKYFNNSEATQKLNLTLKNIIKDKNLSIKFDDSITDEQGNILDGKYENGSITINPNSTRAFEYIATHELTHAIGTKEMLNMVQNYRESNSEFNTKVETLLKNYNKTELTEEALADVSAQLFGTQEFINDVKNKNPNLFQKIYNEIKYLWHQFRGYKNEKQFIEDLYNKWTAAYNSKEELNQTTKYSLAGEKALFADFSKLETAKEMLKNKESSEDIWVKTGWTKGADGKWRFEIDDNEFDIKENALTPDTEKPLHEILDAEKLYDNYPELADIKVITTKLEPGVNGSYERLGNVIYLSNDLISTTMQNKNYKFLGLHNQHKAFVSLLHEIQHYIQKQEGFARGGNVDDMRSVKNSKLRKLGEKIDTLTAQYNREIDEYRNSIHYNETVEELLKIDNPDERSEALYNYRESVKATPRYKEIEKIDNRIKELEKEFYELDDISPFQLYSRLGGEQESRWIEARIETPSEKRKSKKPQYTNENTIFAESDDLMYNNQQRGNDDAIQLGDNLSITSKSGQELGTSRRGGTSSKQSSETSSNGNIYRNTEGNNITEGNIIQRSEGNIGENNQGLEESSSFNLQKNKTIEHKKEQLKIVNETNPMFDDVHVGIRKVDDIKTWEEAMQDDESFVWGDFSREDAEKALKRGTITVYSSYPIKNGVFVSTSYAQAYEYAGHDHSKVHSRKVALDSVAWINGDEGQYAKVKPKVDENKAYQKTLDNAINVLKVQNKTSDTDIYFKAYQIASSEFKKLKTDEDYDIFNNRVVEIEKDLKEKFKELENSDIKYARQGNLEWQEYLEQHFNSEGTRTTKEEVKIAEKNQNKQESKEELIQSFKEETDKIDVLSVDDQIKAIRELDTKELNNKLPDTSTMIVNKLKKEKTTFKDLTTQLRKYITNKGAAVDNLFKATGNEKGIWKYDRYLGSFTEGQTSIGVRQINSNGEVVGDSLLTIYDNAKKDGITQKILDDYVLNKDNIARSNYEKGIFGEFITSNDSQKIVDEYDKKYPKLKDYANEVSNYANNNTKGYLVGNFISEDLYNKIIEMYPNHVPVIRDISETPGMKEYDNVGTQMLKSAKGGDKSILSPKEALAQQSICYAKAFRKNEALKEVYKSIKSDANILYDLGKIVDIEQANMEIQNAVGYDEKLKKYTATIFEDGKAKVFEISKDIYDAFVDNKTIRTVEETMDKLLIGKVLKGATNTFKSVTTGKNILYALKNMARDINDAPINSTTNFANYYKDWAYAYEQIGTNGKYWQEFVNNGGSANTFYDYSNGLLQKENLELPRKIIAKINKETLGRVEQINQVVELAPRLAEYIATRQRGGSIDEALYNSAEITTNFKRGGEISKFIDKYGVPYFNASIQGLSKLYRNVADRKGFKQYANLTISATLAGIAPSIINHLVYEDDDEYEELPDYIKDGYYLVKVDDLPSEASKLFEKYTENNFVRIPKGRVSAVLGGTAVRLHQTISKKSDDVWNGYMSDIVLNNIGINNPLTNNIFSGMIQGTRNEAWYGGTIYSESKYNKKLPVEITDEKTDKLSNWIAETIYDLAVAVGGEEKYKELVKENSLFRIMATPKLLNYVMDQYSGFVGDIVLPMLTPYAEDNAFIDQFTTSSTLKSTTVSEFYDILGNCYSESEYATDTDKLTYNYLSSVSKEVSDLYKKKSEIQNDSDLTNREKQTQTYEIQEEINTKMRETIEKVKKLKISENAATFNDKEYYKDTEGKWKTISEEDKIEGISTDTYAKYKNELKIATEKKREEEGDEEATLDKKEKVAIINSSNYTSEEKKAMYEKSYGDQDSTYKNLSKITNVNIEAYLNYIQEEIKGDDDPNSTKKGKTISGSKKKNLLKYLNNPNSGLSNIEKVYIYGRSYDLNNSQKSMILNAVENSGMTYEEKKEFYLTLHNVYEEEDGSIRGK